MKIFISRELKIKMLGALKRGYITSEEFSDLFPSQVTIFELPDNGRDKR